LLSAAVQDCVAGAVQIALIDWLVGSNSKQDQFTDQSEWTLSMSNVDNSYKRKMFTVQTS